MMTEAARPVSCQQVGVLHRMHLFRRTEYYAV